MPEAAAPAASPSAAVLATNADAPPQAPEAPAPAAPKRKSAGSVVADAIAMLEADEKAAPAKPKVDEPEAKAKDDEKAPPEKKPDDKPEAKPEPKDFAALRVEKRKAAERMAAAEAKEREVSQREAAAEARAKAAEQAEQHGALLEKDPTAWFQAQAKRAGVPLRDFVEKINAALSGAPSQESSDVAEVKSELAKLREERDRERTEAQKRAAAAEIESDLVALATVGTDPAKYPTLTAYEPAEIARMIREVVTSPEVHEFRAKMKRNPTDEELLAGLDKREEARFARIQAKRSAPNAQAASSPDQAPGPVKPARPETATANSSATERVGFTSKRQTDRDRIAEATKAIGG